jgi:hypothetical protein
VVIANPEFYVEEHGGKTNFDQMLQALDAATGDSADSGPGEAAPKAEPVIVIRHLRIDETRAALESHTFDRYTDMQVDAVEMNDLRGTPSQLARQIARTVVEELNSATSSEMLKAKAQRKVDDIQKKVNDKLRDLLGDETDEDAAN